MGEGIHTPVDEQNEEWGLGRGRGVNLVPRVRVMCATPASTELKHPSDRWIGGRSNERILPSPSIGAFGVSMETGHGRGRLLENKTAIPTTTPPSVSAQAGQPEAPQFPQAGVRVAIPFSKTESSFREINSPNTDTSIHDLFVRSSRSQQSQTSLARALGELEGIGLVIH